MATAWTQRSSSRKKGSSFLPFFLSFFKAEPVPFHNRGRQGSSAASWTWESHLRTRQVSPAEDLSPLRTTRETTRKVQSRRVTSSSVWVSALVSQSCTYHIAHSPCHRQLYAHACVFTRIFVLACRCPGVGLQVGFELAQLT